ncbi:endo-1,4-beta-xylanase [Rhodovarius crocodyli]|uniref:endo-1,4-beta-xylanase n=1 Tax=Rhodovarius crocodyli TaxID=1979269 RepID=UPI001F0BDC97|nr:endo-1,4-beta-xylanase [Rhodovarius crocodyli]
MRRRHALGLVASLPGCAVAQTQPAPAETLRSIARAAGRGFGAAVRADLLGSDAAYAALFAAEAELLTPEWEAKWVALQPEEGRFDFSHLNAIITFAQANRQRVRGHALLWQEAIPDWVKAALAEGPDRARGVMEAHFAGVLGTTRQHIRDWDVVNEPIANPPGADVPQAGDNPLRETPWFKALGPNYIEMAFRTARAQDATLRLTLNEYGIEESTPDAEEKRRRLLALLRRLLDKGCPLDALGIQAHLQMRKPFDPAPFARFLDQIRAMGLAILITELDVREPDTLAEGIPARDAAVAERVKQFLDVAVAGGCRTVITWGLTDRNSWLGNEPGVLRRDGATTRGLPFDEELRRKPMWQAIAGALRG